MGLFKKPKAQKSSSGNHAWEAISGSMNPALGYVTSGGDMMSNLLGLGGGAAQTEGLEKFANSGGMQFLQEQGNRQVNSNQAVKGLLNSGSTLTSLQKYGQGLGSTYLNQYMDNLFKLSNIGLGAGGLMAQAGQWSKGQGPTQGGMGKQLIPMVASAAISAASDSRLKYEDKVIGYFDDGLPIHEFRYRQDTPLKLPEGKFVGVMADEVAVLRPDALGPTRKGYLTVADKRLFPKKVGD